MLYFRNKKAFSLIELSIVIVIIGLLIAGVVGSKHIIKKARINAAQAITRSSPINSIAGTKLWLESSLDEISLGGASATGDAINSWQNSANNQNPIIVSKVGSGPTYSNSINSIQAIKFDSNSASNHLEIENPEFLNDTDYTIMITEKRMGTNTGGGNYLLNSSTGFAIGYQSGTSIIQTHGEAASDANQSAVESIDEYKNKPRVIMFTHSSDEGNKIYINGTLANEDSSSAAKTHLTGLSSSARLKIGNNYNGEIGEIAIFDKALKAVDRKLVEDYATDKWNAPNNRDQVSDCTSGIVLSTGCEPSCTIAEIGISYSGLRSTTSATKNCNGTNFKTSDTVEYSCVNGVTTIISGSCSCIDNYSLTGANCEPSAPCESLSITGSTTTSVAHGATTGISCNVANFTGSMTGYSCDNGTFTAGSACQCATGYSDPSTGCTTCDSASGYVSDGSGGCRIANDCSSGLSSINGSTDTVSSLNHGQTQDITCNGTNFDGSTVTYSCNDGTLTPSSSCACATGFLYDSATKTCVQPPIICSGGDKTCIGGASDAYCTGGRFIHVFNSDDVLSCSTTGSSITNVKYLGVGAGGKGGRGRYEIVRSSFYKYGGGGGGGGEVVESTGHTLVAGDYISINVNDKTSDTIMSGTFGGSSINVSFQKGGDGGDYYQNGSAGGRAGGGGAGAGLKTGGTGTPAGGNSPSRTVKSGDYRYYTGQGARGGSLGYLSDITGTGVYYGRGGNQGVPTWGMPQPTYASGAGCGGNAGNASSVEACEPTPNCGGIVVFSYSY